MRHLWLKHLKRLTSRNAFNRNHGNVYVDGRVHLDRVGKYTSNNSSSSPVNYGHKKLSDLIRATELFDVSVRDKGVLYIKSPS
jgi:hypothetical protein